MSKRKKTVPAVNPASEKEKAESYLLFYLYEIQVGNRSVNDFSDWLMQSLTPESVKALAADWDDSQANKPAGEMEAGENE